MPLLLAKVFSPATTPEAKVAITGLCLSLILLSGVNRSPSLAMAKRTRGIGNIEPSKLEEGCHDMNPHVAMIARLSHTTDAVHVCPGQTKQSRNYLE